MRTRATAMTAIAVAASQVFSAAAVNLDFTQPDYLPLGVSYSRTTAGTFIDSAGVLRARPHNYARFTEDISNSAWGASNVAKSNTGFNGPSNAQVMHVVRGSRTTGPLYVGNNFVTGISLGTQQTFSMFVKSGTFGNQAFIQISGSGSDGISFTCNFDDGTSSQTSTNYTVQSSHFAQVTQDGWYLAFITFTSVNSAVIGFKYSPTSGNFGISATGNLEDGFLCAPTLETNSARTFYCKNAGSTLAYGPAWEYDESSLALRGLLIEAAATNLCLQSADLTQLPPISGAPWQATNSTVTANQSAPDGKTDAFLITLASSTGSWIYQNITVTASTAYCLSFWAKAGTYSGQYQCAFYDNTNSAFITQDTSAVQYTPSGTWKRFSFLVRTPSNCTSLRIYLQRNDATYPGTGNFSIFGPQLEAGSYMSSYIATAASTVTRSADTLDYATTMPEGKRGTLQAEWLSSSLDINLNADVATVSDGNVAGSNRLGIRSNSGGNLQSYFASQGTVVFSSVTPANIVGTVVKALLSWEVNTGAKWFVNATRIAHQAWSSGSPSPAPFITIGLGKNFTATEFLNGYLRHVRLWRTQLSEQQSAAITT